MTLGVSTGGFFPSLQISYRLPLPFDAPLIRYRFLKQLACHLLFSSGLGRSITRKPRGEPTQVEQQKMLHPGGAPEKLYLWLVARVSAAFVR